MTEKTDKCTAAPNHKWFGLSLQALVVLSKNEGTCPSCEIASRLQSEATLLRRIMAKLVREQILETREGRDGGYRLKRRPQDITLADVYRALQVGEPLSSGMLDTTGAHSFGLDMKAAFTDIASEMDQCMLEMLQRYTVADLAERTL
jgi:Rrf2 family protein